MCFATAGIPELPCAVARTHDFSGREKAASCRRITRRYFGEGPAQLHLSFRFAATYNKLSPEDIHRLIRSSELRKPKESLVYRVDRAWCEVFAQNLQDLGCAVADYNCIAFCTRANLAGDDFHLRN